MSYDLDINNYSIDELFGFIKMNKSTTQELVEIQIKKIIQSINKNTSNEKVVIFMDQITSKMNNYFDELSIKNSYSELNVVDPLNNINLNNGHKTYNATQYDSKNITAGGEHFIIKNKKTPVNYTYDYKFPIGDVNPVERRLITKTICFNTLFRPNYINTQSCDIKWALPYKIDNVISMRLTDIQLPIQNFMVSSKKKNNIFNVQLFNMVSYTNSENIEFPSGNYNTSIDVTIPDGNYTISLMVTVLNNLFSALKNGLEYLYIDINNITSHLIIRAKDENDPVILTIFPFNSLNPNYSPDFYYTVNFNLNEDPSPSPPRRGAAAEARCRGVEAKYINPLYNIDNKLNLGFLLGFSQSTYTVNKTNQYVFNTGSLDSLTSTVIIYYAYCESEITYGSNTADYFYVYVDDYNNNYYNTIMALTSDSSFFENSILAKINITGNFNQILFGNGSDLILKNREYFGPVNIEKLHIMLLDMYGKPYNLSNNEYSFALEFTILYTN